jgi:MFS family permease
MDHSNVKFTFFDLKAVANNLREAISLLPGGVTDEEGTALLLAERWNWTRSFGYINIGPKETMINQFRSELSMRWPRAFGFLFFVGMMATGYYYNLTFIQFGLLDLGTRLVGMESQQVAMNIALLALMTSAVAILLGLQMNVSGWSRDMRTKLRLAFGVVLIQTALTWLAPHIRSQPAFLAWIVIASFALGVGVPATFGLTVDFVPVRYRGLAGALITAAAYFPAAVLTPDWTIEQFSGRILGLMLAGTAGLGMLAFAPLGFVDRLATQHHLPEYGLGRFVRVDQGGRRIIRRSLLVLLALMFGIYFIDSLGFLRLAETPYFFETAWQSSEPGPRLAIGAVHVMAALIGGVLYTALPEKELFLWIFGIFALVHLMYTIVARSTFTGEPPLAMPLLYAVAVSLYTVVNFAIWADISTPDTISRNSAMGVALSGWTATFLSTALALWMKQGGVSMELHLRIVDSLAVLFFLGVVFLIFFGPVGKARESRLR